MQPPAGALQGTPQVTFSTACKSDLSRHMKQHTEYSLFACPHCDYRTRRSNDLKKHLRIHTGEKPYCCSFCGYRTNTTIPWVNPAKWLSDARGNRDEDAGRLSGMNEDLRVGVRQHDMASKVPSSCHKPRFPHNDLYLI
ncbi:zinc finger protein 771-like [Penaeus monodon]|uniref:zinc finger protein 771-like n=1 Tax=Penaeus monodon TaxID=6687 RepID=UPI0018A7DC44|nr:zinc finger protein 771-like [Penaeus monodon]